MPTGCLFPESDLWPHLMQPGTHPLWMAEHVCPGPGGTLTLLPLIGLLWAALTSHYLLPDPARRKVWSLSAVRQRKAPHRLQLPAGPPLCVG